MKDNFNFIEVSDNPVGYSVSVFPDGELNVTLDSSIDRKKPVLLSVCLKSSDSLFVLMQLSDIIRRQELVVKKIVVKYLMGMRCDRLFSLDRPFTLKIVADVINSFNAQKVVVVEPHSERTLQLINNAIEYDFTLEYTKMLQKDNPNMKFIAPDAGAMTRYNETGICFCGNFEKKRDLTTGRILSLEFKTTLPEHAIITKDDTVCIIDDLCDGGGTFIMAGEYMRKNFPEGAKLILVVTHAIQQSGLEKLAQVYDEVYISDSYKDWHAVLKDNPNMTNIKVNTII